MKKIFLFCFIFLISCIGTNRVLTNESGSNLHWSYSDFPLDVVISSQIPEIFQENIIQSIELWNQQVGADVFRFREEIRWNSSEFVRPRHATVYFQMDNLNEDRFNRAAETEVRWNAPSPNLTGATIYLDVALPPDRARLVVAHDSFRGSLMFESVSFNSSARILEEDLRYVRWEMSYDGE